MLCILISILQRFKSVKNLKSLFLNVPSLDEAFLFLCYTARSYTVKERNFILDDTYDQAMYSKVILGSKTTEM